MNNKSSKIQLFQKRVTDFLSETYPGEPGRFFLHIHTGRRDAEAVSELRRGLPGNIFILYISESSFDKEPEVNRVLFADFASELLPLKISMLTGLLRIDDGHRISMSCEKGLEKLYEKILPLIQNSASEAVSNIKCKKRASLIQARCSIRNIPMIFSDRSRDLGKAPGASALICGAGPSLSEQLETIKNNSEKFVLICVGRLAKAFSENGIKPDFSVEMDSECYLNWEHSEKIDFPLATFPIISPEVAERFPEIIWFAEPSSPFTEFMKKKNIELPPLSISRSVIVSAIDLALKLGCDKIALAGNDLCVSEDGNAYAEESQKEERESLFEVPGTNGKNVFTNTNFDGVREVLQRYIGAFKETRKNIKIYNCTPNGALIQNTEPLSLNDFIDGCGKVDKSNIFSAFSLPSPSLENDMNDIEKYAKIAGNIINAATDIQSALDAKDMSKAKELQNKLKAAFEAESCMKNSSSARPLLSLVRDYSEDIAMDFPEPRPADDDLLSQTIKLQKKYSLIKDLCKDFRGDFMKSEETSYDFQAFRNFGISLINKSNPAFAELLKKMPFASPDFILRANQQYLPSSVIKRLDDGSFFEIVDGALDMEAKARDAVVEFINKNNFDPEKCAAIFVAPGNWAHVVEFANIFPNAEIMAVEPWSELLSSLISRSMFMQSLPDKTTVVGADERLSGWKKIYHSKKREWTRAGKEVVFFEHPLTWQLDEIKKLLKKLPS
jgi:hypothetical protein